MTALAQGEPKPPQCVKVLTMSGWNPPPPHRKLTGDLLYLIVQTLEGKYFHVTGATWGFYVNLSNEEEFNPRPASPSLLSHSLIELLNQLSPSFKRNFASKWFVSGSSSLTYVSCVAIPSITNLI